MRRASSHFRLVAATLLAILATATATAAAAQPAWTAFSRVFDATIDSGRVVGAAAVLVRDGRVVARRMHGVGDLQHPAPVSERTLFHFGSITKTLTAVAILQLRDAGRLGLDDPITRWVPELRRVHDPYGMIDSVTLRMLLSHTAGFQAPTWPYRRGRPWEPFEPTEWAQLVAMMPYEQLEFRPGSRFGYSNPGYVYLAQVIERASGEPWTTYVHKRILAPLGLTRSYFGVTPPHLAADRSNSYTVRVDSAGAVALRPHGREFDPGVTIPNGGWNAPLDEVAAWGAFLVGAAPGDTAASRRHDAVLRRASVEEMWRPVAPGGPPNAAGAGMAMGLGVALLGDDGTRLVGHTGTQAGFNAFLWCNPATRSCAVAVFNTADARRPPAITRTGPQWGALQDALVRLLR